MSCSILPAFAWAAFLMMMLFAKESNAFGGMVSYSGPTCPECKEGRVRKSDSCGTFEKKECSPAPSAPPAPPAPPPAPPAPENATYLNETWMEETYGEDWRELIGFDRYSDWLSCQPCSCACELDPGTVAWVTVCCLVPVILLLGCCWCCGCCCFRRRRLPQAQV